jgi:hypothetical protein
MYLTVNFDLDIYKIEDNAMNISYKFLFIMSILLIIFTGCNKGNISFWGETQLDKNWSRSYETAKYNQIINPEAGKKVTPVQGLEGNAADHAVQGYHDTFKQRKEQEVVNILKLQ